MRSKRLATSLNYNATDEKAVENDVVCKKMFGRLDCNATDDEVWKEMFFRVCEDRRGTSNGVLMIVSNERGRISRNGCNDDDDDKESKVGIESWVKENRTSV